MEKLPNSLSFDTLINLAYPDDTTIGEIKAIFPTSNAGREILHALIMEGLKDTTKLAINFEDMNGNELPNDLTMLNLRVLLLAKKAKIVLDDGSGGVSTKPKVPELV